MVNMISLMIIFYYLWNFTENFTKVRVSRVSQNFSSILQNFIGAIYFCKILSVSILSGVI